MLEHEQQSHRRFYAQTIRHIHNTYNTPDDLCFVYVQHAFSPSITHLSCVDDRMAALIPKGSSSKGNPEVVTALQERFPGRIYSKVTRKHLADPAYAVQFLKQVTKGRPFVVLEYGAYFAPAALRIATDLHLGPKLAGFVEGTENGIRGSDDGFTPGYQQLATQIPCPIVSKSKSSIKHIMDLEIGPAIVESSDNLLRRCLGTRLQHGRCNIGVVGLGSIGRGILQSLSKLNINPRVYDTNPSVMAEMACNQQHVASRQAILNNSDVLFLNTGSCFLSQQPQLLCELKDYAILILCTSGEVEAGIPQLIDAGHLQHIATEGADNLALFRTKKNRHIRVMLGNDRIGQAPNMVVEDGSGSPANLMSDMEFYAIGAYLASPQNELPTNTISNSPLELQQLILNEWLQEFYPASVDGKLYPRQASVARLSPQHPETSRQSLPDSGLPSRQHQMR